MGFANYDDLITQITTNGQKDHYDLTKITLGVGSGVGTWYSFFNSLGMPGAGSYSSQANTAQTGSLNFPNVSTKTRHLLSFGAVYPTNGVLMLYDRLVEVSGISVATTGSKTVSTAALGRYSTNALSAGVQAWLEVTTATTVTKPVVHLLSYTNNSGTAAQVGGSFTFPAVATAVQTMLGPLPLAAGDLGVQAVSTLNVDTAGSAGVCSLVLLRPLAYLPIFANQWTQRDMVMQYASLERLYDGHSLHVMFLQQAAIVANNQLWTTIESGYA